MAMSARESRNEKEEHSSESEFQSDFDDYPLWNEGSLSPAQVAEVNRRLENAISMLAPCPDCSMITPQAYSREPGTGFVPKWLGPSTDKPKYDIGRIVRCGVCLTTWGHHVDFKGYPYQQSDLSRFEEVNTQK